MAKEEFELHISTGFPKFDELIHGLEKARLIIVGGRPAMGKSAFAISMAKNIAVEQNVPTAFFSLEMSSKHLTQRLVCCISHLDNRRIVNGLQTEEENKQYKSGLARLTTCPLYIDDTPGLSIPKFREKVIQMVNEHGVRLILVDYLQLMDTWRKIDNKNASSPDSNELQRIEWGKVGKSLRDIATELNVTIIVCSHLRHRKANGWHKPCLNRIVGYKTICKYADVVALIHRPEYYCILTPESGGQNKHALAQIIVKRNNLGSTGDFFLRFDTSASRFYNCMND